MNFMVVTVRGFVKYIICKVTIMCIVLAILCNNGIRDIMSFGEGERGDRERESDTDRVRL